MLLQRCHGRQNFPPPAGDQETRSQGYWNSIFGENFRYRKSGNEACTGQEVAKEISRLGHGYFSHFILEGLKGKADYKNDGTVDLEELWMYVQDHMARGKEKQHPVRAGWIIGDVINLSQYGPVSFVTPTRNTKTRLKNQIIKRFELCKLKEVKIADNDKITTIGKEAAHFLSKKLIFFPLFLLRNFEHRF